MFSKRERFSLVARSALPVGQQKVARKAVLDAHDVAHLAELGDALEQDHFHCVSPSVDGSNSSSPQARRSALSGDATANVEDGFGET